MDNLITKTSSDIEPVTSNERYDQAGIGGLSKKQLQQELTDVVSKNGLDPGKVKVKTTDLVFFTTQLSVMLESGVVLSDSLDSIAEQMENESFMMLVGQLSEYVKSGRSFSEALAEYPLVFNTMFVGMVKSSEATGRMAEMLGLLSSYLDFEAQTHRQVKSALAYPCIMASMAVVAISIMMFFVLPRFTRIYDLMDVELPLATRLLVNFSKLISNGESLMMFLTTILFVGFLFYTWLKSLSGKKTTDYMKIKAPVIGTMFKDMVITRSMRIMSTMLNSGVSIIDVIKVIKGANDNILFYELWDQTEDKIRDGYQLSESIAISTGHEMMPSGIMQMIKAGEKSGRLGDVCGKISDFYEKRFAASIKGVTALIEPLMLVVLGSIIGAVVIALLLPVFKISSAMAH